MNINKFEQEFKHLINVPVFKYNSKAYNKKYGNVSVHEKEFNPLNFYYIEIDNEVYHISYHKEVMLSNTVIKNGIAKKYGLIAGNYLIKITENYLLDNKYIDYTPVEEYSKKLEEKYSEILDSTNVSLKIENNFKKLVELYKAKNKEYSTDTWDSNFIKGANILQQTKEETLLGYVTKHIVSVVDIIKGKPANLDTVKEKIGDIQIYMALLQLMFEEKLEK